MAMKKKSSRLVDRDSPAVEANEYKRPEERKGGPFSDYEVRDAMSTLSAAMKIKKNSALLAACRKAAKEQLANITKATAR